MIFKSLSIYCHFDMAYELQQAELDWAEISKKINEVEPVFQTKLRKSVTLSVSSNKVQILYDRKTFNSAYEKCQAKNITFDKLTDLLRAKILYSRKIDPEKLINGIEKVFGRGNITKIDRRDVPKPGKEYFGSIHIDVNVNGIICEIQLMRKNLHSYVEESRKYYKTPSGERITELPEKQRNIERSLFERANRPQDIQPERFEPEIDVDASLLSAINAFYKTAMAKYKTMQVTDNKNRKMVRVRFPASIILKAIDDTEHQIELEPQDGEDAIYVVAPEGYKFSGHELHEMLYDPFKISELKSETLEPCTDPNCDYCHEIESEASIINAIELFYKFAQII